MHAWDLTWQCMVDPKQKGGGSTQKPERVRVWGLVLLPAVRSKEERKESNRWRDLDFL